MLRDGIVDLSELCVAVGVLTVFVPLAVALVLKVAAFLSFESLVDLAALVASHRLLGLLGHYRLRLHVVLLLLVHLLTGVHQNALVWHHLLQRRLRSIEVSVGSAGVLLLL